MDFNVIIYNPAVLTATCFLDEAEKIPCPRL